MSSAQGSSLPPTLNEELEESEGKQIQRKDGAQQHPEPPTVTPELEPRPDSEHQTETDPQQEHEPVASSSHSQTSDQPPETPPKDRDSGARLSVFNSPRSSQVLDWNTAAQPSFTAAGQLMSYDTNRPDHPQTSNMTSARPLVNHPIAVGNDGTDYPNVNMNTTGSTSNVSNRNTTTEGPNITTNANPEVIRPIPVTTPTASPNHNRVQIRSPPSRPLSSLERRPTGPGLTPHDPIRGDIPFQGLYYSDLNGYDDGGEPAGMQSAGPGRRSMVALADGSVVGNGPGGWPGSRRASRLMSGQDWLAGIPGVVQPPRPKTLEQRLKPTVDAATVERDRFQTRSSRQNILINGAIALQIVVGALTTGVAAAGSRHIGSAVAALGGLSTVLASYLAKVRGSGEPEFSTVRARELNTFLREVETFVMDHGDKTGTDYEDQIMTFRERFEAIIKTDGEDSGSGAGFLHHAPPMQPPTTQVPPPSAHLANGHTSVMPGAYDPHGLEKKRHLSKDEKALNAAV